MLAELRRWGIAYLMAANGIHDLWAPLVPVALVGALATSSDPRIRDALVALLLLYPELAEVAPQALAQSNNQTAAQIHTLTLAALYEQRIWYPLLTMAFGKPPNLQEAPCAAFWRDRRLPPRGLRLAWQARRRCGRTSRRAMCPTSNCSLNKD
ncbi:MAG: hypothetical protein ABI068_14160 [Ktedonobacterales bacterium]